MLDDLNAHPDWYPPKRTRLFNGNSLSTLLSHVRIRTGPHERPTDGIWTVVELASELEMPATTVYSWIKKGRVRAQRIEDERGRSGWQMSVTEEELEHLRQRRRSPRS